jgi:hypothetical protein
MIFFIRDRHYILLEPDESTAKILILPGEILIRGIHIGHRNGISIDVI